MRVLGAPPERQRQVILPPLRAWTGVHEVRAGALLLVAGAALTAVFGTRQIFDFLIFSYRGGTFLSLLLAALPAYAAVVACCCELSVLRSRRMVAARLGWVTCWVAAAVVLPPMVAGLPTDLAPSYARNVLLGVAAALVVAVAIGAVWAWVPLTVVVLMCLTVGAQSSVPHWWAIPIQSATTPGQWLVVATSVLCAFGLYAWRGLRFERFVGG